ncbi:hypothetical protein LRS73_03810 [Methylobacterium currus]|jgi:hypothetical protein|uniref:hypothetical protein n=1 Tax=Methylobacterium currus TaxID=2051553 RepID=UPI001E36427A|nr:hypothetical protein [Methylobacterium currus]UHC17052.1 hypothetical protein LRS73_03810 [Methylobacterium currus]
MTSYRISQKNNIFITGRGVEYAKLFTKLIKEKDPGEMVIAISWQEKYRMIDPSLTADLRSLKENMSKEDYGKELERRSALKSIPLEPRVEFGALPISSCKEDDIITIDGINFLLDETAFEKTDKEHITIDVEDISQGPVVKG